METVFTLLGDTVHKQWAVLARRRSTGTGASTLSAKENIELYFMRVTNIASILRSLRILTIKENEV